MTYLWDIKGPKQIKTDLDIFIGDPIVKIRDEKLGAGFNSKGTAGCFFEKRSAPSHRSTRHKRLAIFIHASALTEDFPVIDLSHSLPLSLSHSFVHQNEAVCSFPSVTNNPLFVH